MSPFAKLGERQGYFARWSWYIDRLADIAVAGMNGDITDTEYIGLRTYYHALWQNCAPRSTT